MENLPTPEQLINEIKKALDILKKDYSHLFMSDVHEINIVNHVACVLRKCKFLSHYLIDLENNRITGIDPNQIIKKTSEVDPKDFFRPDLIIHIPRTQLANLLVVEFSKEKNTKREEHTLKEMTKRGGKYGYRMGLLIDLPKYESWRFFVDGESFNNKEEAIKKLDYLNKEAVIALNNFKNINLNYRVREEDYEESKIKVAMVKDSGNDLEWDEASNVSELIHARNKEALEVECENFQSDFKKYFQVAFVPEYFRCSDIVEHLYKNTLEDAEKNYSGLNSMLIDNWFMNSDLVFPYVERLCLYCHYSLEGNPKKQRILYKLEQDFEDPNFDGSLNF